MSSSPSEPGKVPTTHAAFPLWMATLSLWEKETGMTAALQLPRKFADRAFEKISCTKFLQLILYFLIARIVIF